MANINAVELSQLESLIKISRLFQEVHYSRYFHNKAKLLKLCNCVLANKQSEHCDICGDIRFSIIEKDNGSLSFVENDFGIKFNESKIDFRSFEDTYKLYSLYKCFVSAFEKLETLDRIDKIHYICSCQVCNSSGKVRSERFKDRMESYDICPVCHGSLFSMCCFEKTNKVRPTTDSKEVFPNRPPFHNG